MPPSRGSGPRGWRRSTRRPSPSGRRVRTRHSGIGRAETGSLMRRGDIYLVDLEPERGSEATRIRPAVIVSNDGANGSVALNRRGLIAVVPLTSDTARVL